MPSTKVGNKKYLLRWFKWPNLKQEASPQVYNLPWLSIAQLCIKPHAILIKKGNFWCV